MPIERGLLFSPWPSSGRISGAFACAIVGVLGLLYPRDPLPAAQLGSELAQRCATDQSRTSTWARIAASTWSCDSVRQVDYGVVNHVASPGGGAP